MITVVYDRLREEEKLLKGESNSHNTHPEYGILRK